MVPWIWDLLGIWCLVFGISHAVSCVKMPRPLLSVVIPTHKRADILKRCIDHLAAQTIRDKLEVIVVSDGHDEETEDMIKYGTWEIPVVFAEIEKAQQGAARNKGVETASGTYVLFIGDDIFLDPECCERHVKAHESCGLQATNYEVGSSRSSQLAARGIAVLGFTTWDPACGVTPVMTWLESSGWQFGYPMIAQYKHQFLPAEIQHKFTYTSNISVPTNVAKDHPFLADIHLYGWEDIEWGHRKKKAGIRVFYEPDAKALHHHHIELADSLKRMETLGMSVHHIEERTPDLRLKPRGMKLLAYHLTALMPTMMGKHRRAFLRGLRSR